ncbi:hypothetical protein [Brevibacterium atlanticum]|uniref:hypothetical protein n=1 Tax=Brevibacterium atlanticum TaxID=2697563 RepID=UPI00141EFC9A|nr:hypothetical protein [Brevibacterium atlanticum]
MSDDLLVRSRSTLLDALEALRAQGHAVIVIGAQAVYLRTGGIDVALAEATKDSDVTIDPRRLNDAPLLEEAMRSAGFFPLDQPGSWAREDGIPIDLMVPEGLGGGGRRGARIPPHSKRATRKARGLEAALVDFGELEISAIDHGDGRTMRANVAGSAALLVAKLHKIAERVEAPHRLNDKDAHDIYRILRAESTDDLRRSFSGLLSDELSRVASEEALAHLARLFAAGDSAVGSLMAGRAEVGIGSPAEVSAASAVLSSDLIDALRRDS